MSEGRLERTRQAYRPQSPFRRQTHVWVRKTLNGYEECSEEQSTELDRRHQLQDEAMK